MATLFERVWNAITFKVPPSVNGAPVVVAKEVTFAENGAGTYTGSVSVPAGATILDIQLRSTALWAAATSATMKVGDAADDDGWYTAVNLKATDLLVGEVVRFNSTGGKEGAYVVTTTGELEKSYNSAATVVTGVVTSVGAGTAGRTRMLVVYAPASVTGEATAATKA